MLVHYMQNIGSIESCSTTLLSMVHQYCLLVNNNTVYIVIMVVAQLIMTLVALAKP